MSRRRAKSTALLLFFWFGYTQTRYDVPPVTVRSRAPSLGGEALLLDSLGCARESEKALRDVIAGYIEEELYKDAFIGLLTFFETLVKRGALRKAKQVYKEAADLLAQAGTGSHDQMRQVWRQLLRQMDGDSLKDYQLQEVRQ